MLTDEEILKLKKTALDVRKKIIKMIYTAKSGHPGGALSCVELLTYLYLKGMNVSPEEPKLKNRDRFVLSKGHAAPALYALLCVKGFFPKEELDKFRSINGILQGHPDMNKIPGIDISTGSLGHGASCAVGMALAGKIDSLNYKVYSILGDGELEEGQIWEAVMFAAHHKLDNLALIVDENNLQIDGTTEEILNIKPIDKKFESFGFNTVSIDGHDFKKIDNAIDNFKELTGKPTVIIAKTIKGKGISFMEDNLDWHGKPVNDEEYKICEHELLEQETALNMEN